MTVDKTGVDETLVDEDELGINPLMHRHTPTSLQAPPNSGAYCSRYLEAQNGTTYVHTHLFLEVSCSISLLNAVQTNVTPDWREVGALELQSLLNVT